MPVPSLEIDKRLIFTVTSGRSGTAYLTELFKIIPDVASFHEPEPSYAQVLRRIQSDPYISYPFLLQNKLPEILKSQEGIYVETSHLLCKGFIEPLLRMNLRPSLIFLRRNPRDVAWSFMERLTIPGRTTNGIQHLLDPRDMNVMPFHNWQAASNYQLCFWYALEMERRYIHYAHMARQFGLAMFDTTSHELNDFNTFREMLRVLGIKPPANVEKAHKDVSAQRFNPNKAYHDIDESLPEQEEAVWDAAEHFVPGLRDIVAARYRNEVHHPVG